jgi:Abnormal spindle-like microcephaly-assoc'd, ASPM-SPD-2-Hydin
MYTKMFRLTGTLGGNEVQRVAVTQVAAWPSAARHLAAWAGLGFLLSCVIASSGCGGGGAQATQASPDPQLSLGQTSVSFPDTNVGATSNETATVTLQNIGNAMLAISSVGDSDNKDFPASTNCPTPGSLAPGSSCTISIQFTPQSSGALTGQIAISTNGGTGTISLSGNGIAQSSCQIGPLGVNDTGFTAGQSVFIVFQNVGQVPVSITDIALSGDFALFDGTGGAWPTCPSTPFSLNPQQACNVYVQFNPVGSGNFTGALNATTSCSAQPLVTYTFSGSN